MGLFGKKSRAAGQHSAVTVIAKGCTLEGQLRLECDIQVDGHVSGELHVAKTLIVSEGGTINGEIFADHVIVNGNVEGVCHANRIEILNNGVVNGTVFSEALSIEPGGRFVGTTASEPADQVVNISAKEEAVTPLAKVK